MSQEKKKESLLIEAGHESRNLFLERTIEHWLTSVNELGYQMPFCQMLSSEGYTVIHNSKQNAFEQGKDVIAISPDGIPCGFQLKGPKISNKEWRNEVFGEIEALRNLTIIHPSIDKNKHHLSYLVTNGELEDTVRLEIDNLNSGKWRDNPLKVITRGELANRFIKISSGFVPYKIDDYKRFLELYFSDGTEQIDKEKVAAFLISVLRPEEDSSNEKKKRNIAAAVLFSGYIISAFVNRSNQISILQTLSLLLAHILCVAEKSNLKENYWLRSFDIVWDEMMLAGDRLQKEIERDELEKMAKSIFDGEFIIYRKNLAVSFLLAFKSAQLIQGNLNWKDALNDGFMQKLKGTLILWGEAAIFPFILVFILTRKAAKADIMANNWFKSICTAIETIILLNGRKGNGNLLSPYYDVQTIIDMRFGLLEEPIDESFSYRSFVVASLISLLARYNGRKELEGYWKELTHIAQNDFTPNETWQHFLWRCDKGKNKSVFPKQTQSWAELVKEANTIDFKQIPWTIQKHPYFLPFFLLVYPHRISSNYIKFFDGIVNKGKEDN